MKRVLLFFKNLIFSALFFVILLEMLIQGVDLFRFRNLQSSSIALDSFYAADENTMDVVCIGSSSVYRFFSAPVMYKEQQITMYNYATAQMPFEAGIDLLDEISYTQKPKLFVIDVRGFIVRIKNILSKNAETDAYLEQQESYINRILNNMPITPARSSLIHRVVPEYLNQNELIWQFEYARTHYNWKDLTKDDVLNFVKKKLGKEVQEEPLLDKNGEPMEENNYKGAVTVSSVDYVEAVDVSKYTKTATLSKDRVKILDDYVKKIKEKGYNVLFISTPYPVTEEQYSYEKYFDEYFKKNGMNYLNCNNIYNEIGIDFSSDFYDRKHVNTLGAYKVTSYLGKYIKEHYKLKPTLLSKTQQKDWQTSTDLWYKEVYEPGVEKIMTTVNKHKAKGSTNY